MKKLFHPALISLVAMTLLTGCLNLQFGGGSKSQIQKPTTGQQLLDLQKAKEAGAITDTEYQVQKQKVLENK
jgi:hypothetical protein